MSEHRIERELREAEVPNSGAAEERSWQVISAAHASRSRGARPLHRRVQRLGAALAGISALILALALTPAGAAVRGWVVDAIDAQSTEKRPALTELPAPGELLVASERGLWLVQDDGSQRLLGDYRDGGFTPRGLFIYAVRGQQLIALERDGTVRWSSTAPRRVADARWAPSGYRVAYRTGDQLRVIAGDGTGDGQLADSVDPVAPSWRPPPAGVDPRTGRNILTYSSRGTLRTVDADTGRQLWERPVAGDVASIEWIDRDRLVLAGDRGVTLLERHGREPRPVELPTGVRVDSVSASADGERLGIVVSGSRGGPGADSRSRLLLARIAGGAERVRAVFSGPGRFGRTAFSPDGRWLLLPWEDPDQWLFIAPDEHRKMLRRVISIEDIARQFDPGGRGETSSPRVLAWCCG